MRILIAEDDSTSRNMLSAILERAGHDVVETSDGAAAWEQLRKPDAPKLAILDWMMPGIEGLEVVRRVRSVQTPERPYIIMLTTKHDKTDIVTALDTGADDYLTKPFDTGELRARIEVGVRMLRVQSQLAENVDELETALEQIKTLRGIIPICAHCKKIRDSKGYWHQVEVYVRDHSKADFSHGLCADCMAELYPEEAAEYLAERDAT